MDENQDQDGIPKQMSRESVVKEVAKLVMSRFNQTNETVGPFNSETGIALEVKKACVEKFGEKVGEQAEQLALTFMEKLTKKWEAEHGTVDHGPVDRDDGLARLKELLGNVKEKVESIGDTTNNGHAPGNNIMQDEGAFKNADVGTKQPIKVPGQKGALPDVHKQNLPKAPSNNPLVKGIKKVWNAVSEESVAEGNTDLEDIRRLSGLAK
jgi:hypothetical protein